MDANGNKPVALWSVPRSISTAFERVFVERDDFEVLHEPFSASYYYSEDRLSDRYADVDPEAERNYENVLASVLAPRESTEERLARHGGRLVPKPRELQDRRGQVRRRRHRRAPAGLEARTAHHEGNVG